MEQITASDGCELAYTAQGDVTRPTLVLLHSIGCDSRMWDAQAAALRERFRVVRPDCRGHGGSDAPEPDYSLARLGRDVIDLLDHLGAARAHVCGLSLGGLVAQWLAIEAPERLATLVLANTAPRIGSAEAWARRAEVVRRDGTGAIAELAMGRFFGEAFRHAQPKVVARTCAQLLATAAAGYAGCCAALRDADLTREIGGIHAPTLLIAGRQDVSTPPEQMQALHGSLTGSLFMELEAAHLSNLEQPQAFTAALLEHLERG